MLIKKRASNIKTAQVDWDGYRILAKRELEIMQENINQLVAHPDAEKLDNVVNGLTEKLYKAARTCEKRLVKMVPVVQDVTKNMNTADEILQKHSAGLCTWEEWDTARREAAGVISDMLYSSMIQSWSETWKDRVERKL